MATIKSHRSNQMDMLNGPLLGKLFLFALPLAASSILQQLFNSADSAVVGRFAGGQALAAVGSNSSVISLMINLFVGLAVGVNVVMAQLIGQQHREKLSEVVHTALALSLISGCFMLVLGQFIAAPLLRLMNTPEDILDLAVLYLRVWFLGMPFFMVYNFGAAILRSIGDTRRPLYCLIISGVVNVLLNLLLVIVFHLSVVGVAIATDISNGVSAAIVIRILMREDEEIRFFPRKLRLYRPHLVQIFRIGAPAGLQGMLFSISNVCVQSAVNSFDSTVVAASAAALTYEYITYFVVNAFSQATVTFTSQNYAAGRFDRCKQVFRLSTICGIAICEVMSLAIVCFGRFFLHFFSVDAMVISYGLIRMRHALTLEGLCGSYEISGAALRGMGRSMLPAILTMLGTVGIRLLWVFAVFPRFRDFGMLMNVYPVTWVITGIFVLTAYFLCRRRAFRQTPAAA